MELTHFEKNVTSPQYPRKCRWHYLYLGLAFLVIGIFIVVNGYTQAIPQSDAMWQKNLNVMNKVVPITENETILRDMVISILSSAKEGWSLFLKEKARSTGMYFMFVGIYLLGSYFREKRYRRLIEKIWPESRTSTA